MSKENLEAMYRSIGRSLSHDVALPPEPTPQPTAEPISKEEEWHTLLKTKFPLPPTWEAADFVSPRQIHLMEPTAYRRYYASPDPHGSNFRNKVTFVLQSYPFGKEAN
jgi:hypothetical protein